MAEVDSRQREVKPHGTFEFPMEFYDCNNTVYKDLYIHWHPDMEVIYVITGSIYLRLNNIEVTGVKGDFIFINPETVHYIHSGQELLKFKSLVFGMQTLSGGADDYIQNEIVQPLVSQRMKLSEKISPGDKCYDELKSAFFALDVCCREKLRFYQIEAKQHLYRMLYAVLNGGHFSTVTHPSIKVSKAVMAAVTYIHNNYSGDITPAAVAQHVHYNEYYFMRVFKKYTGSTVVEFITDYRFEKAKELLRSTDNSIEEVAMFVGFSTTSYFSSRFHERFMLTPGEYRKKHGQRQMSDT